MATDDVSNPLPPSSHSSDATGTGFSQRASSPQGETFWSIDVYRFDGEHDCWRCHSLFNCTEVCPKHLSPTRAIQGVKRTVIFDWLRARLTSY